MSVRDLKHDEEAKREDTQGMADPRTFDITLEPTDSPNQQNFMNCYCYGPAYPPCC